MKIKAIEKMVKAEKTLVIKTAADGDVWVGTGSAMYNIGAVGTSPVQTVRWLFGLSETEAERFDADDHGFVIPEQPEAFLDEDFLFKVGFFDDKGNTAEPHVFSGAVFLLAGGDVAPLAGEKNLSYRYGPQEQRIFIMRGMFPVAAICAKPARADLPFVREVETVLKLIRHQSGLDE